MTYRRKATGYSSNDSYVESVDVTDATKTIGSGDKNRVWHQESNNNSWVVFTLPALSAVEEGFWAIFIVTKAAVGIELDASGSDKISFQGQADQTKVYTVGTLHTTGFLRATSDGYWLFSTLKGAWSLGAHP